MDSSPPGIARPLPDVCGTRASSVIVHRLAEESAGAFLEWQRGITAAAAGFPGYQATEIYPPSGRRHEWVVIVHFEAPEALRTWLDSPDRSGWVARLPRENGTFRLKMLPSGFGDWFADLAEDGGPLPHWKMALTVLLGLYPTVMLLTLFLAPYTQRFGPAVSILIGNAASVPFLEWVGMPFLRRLLGPWLRANGDDGRARSLAGLILILAALGLMAFLFRMATEPSGMRP